MSWTNTGNNRSSIFETFNSPSFADEEHCIRSEHIDSSDEQRNDFNDVDCEVIEEEESNATLWMSCSPGRDSPDEGDEDEVEYEDEDDSLPLACFQTNKSLQKPKKTVVKSTKSHKKKPKDVNAPKKPMSAYSLFFRDTQSSIKAQNPQATFGDVSRIVASMWDSLDAHDKEKYNNQADKLKQLYLKELKSYEASKKIAVPPKKKSQSKPKQVSEKQVSESESDTESLAKKKTQSKSKQVSAKQVSESESETETPVKKKSQSKSKQVAEKQVSESESETEPSVKKKSQSKSKQTSNSHLENDKSSKKITPKKVKESSDEDWESKNPIKTIKTKTKCSSDVDYSASDHSSSSDDVDFPSSKVSAPRCTRTDCNNIAIDDARWDFEFCSVDCVVSHCKDVFNGWVASLRAVKLD